MVICKLIGASYLTAPLELREKLALTIREKNELVDSCLSDQRVREVMILGTCNRMEIYLLLEEELAEGLVWEWLACRSGMPLQALQSYLYSYTGLAAVRHLFKVACGLDSLILGEEQIIGQVREAYQHGIAAGSVQGYFHHLGSEALRIGKRVRAETGIARSSASIPLAAVRLVQQSFTDVQSLRAVVLGAGDMGRLALHELRRAGVTSLMLVNRNEERGQELACEYGCQSLTWADKQTALAEADVVISSTGAPHFVLTCEDFREVRRPAERPVICVDIAVPRDVEPAVGSIPGVRVYNIDDLRPIAYELLAEYGLNGGQAQGMIEGEVQAFAAWQKTQKVHPVIREFRAQAELIRLEELERARPRLELLGDEGTELVMELTHRIVARLLHKPTVQLKKIATDKTDFALSLICELYSLAIPGQHREEPACQNITR